MIERVIENWLTSVNERQYQLPFCQVLAHMGEAVTYVSTHGQFELGKDVITVPKDGIPNAYQLKAGKLTMTEWRKFQGEIQQLVEYPIDNPSLKRTKEHRPFLVTNGQINDTVLNAIRHANESWKRRKFKQLETINGTQLQALFKAAHGSYLPREPGDLELFLELYVANGREPLAKKRFARLLESVLPLQHAHRPHREVQRAITSAVLLTSYSLQYRTHEENWWAIFEAWVMMASYILASAEKFATPDKWWRASFDLCQDGAFRALEGLLEECEKNTTQFVVPDFAEGHFFGSRMTILAGLLGAYDIAMGIQKSEAPRPFIGSFLETYLPKAKFWGESATPFLMIAALACEKRGRQRTAEGLAFQMISTIADLNGSHGRGLPNPYYGPEESIRLMGGLETTNPEMFSGVSYSLESVVHFLARRWLRVSLSLVWNRITSVQYAAFRPAKDWQWFMWKSPQGTLETISPGAPQSWSALLKQAENMENDQVPDLLKSEPVFALFFALVFPHRFQPGLLKVIEKALV